MNLNYVLLKVITFLHFLLILFVVGVPFVDSNYLLLVHSIFVPFMIVHWICNDNTCVLTLIERKLRKELYNQEPSEDDCITCKLINPIYDFKKNNNDFSNVIYTITFLLFFISFLRLIYKYKVGLISNFADLMKI